jgi:cyclopropane-fatty-acyl-phospholipid synthase
MRVLDIGCGWGSFARFAAEKYGVEVVGITLSQQRLELARTVCSGLPVELRLEDYRNLRGSFDAVVSLGMFEHVGSKNYRTFFGVTRHAVRDAGRFFLATIGSNRSVRATDPWIERYIFPKLSSPIDSSNRSSCRRFVCGGGIAELGSGLRSDIDGVVSQFRSQLYRLKEKYGERFHRMWRYYLLASAGSFRSRRLQVWQILLSPAGIVR